MSDVPLHPNSHIGDEWSDPEVTAIEKYGDARAAEARRLTLLEVADWLADNDRLTEWRTLEPLINTLRALANKASPT